MFCNVHTHNNNTIFLLLPNGINLFSVSIINYNSLNHALWILTKMSYGKWEMLHPKMLDVIHLVHKALLFKTEKQQ